MGCGITAISEEAAIELLKRRVFKGAPLPKFTVQADIDISTLDPGRVRPNMHVPVWPGVWFPMGFEGD
jgi:hypothetical protein